MGSANATFIIKKQRKGMPAGRLSSIGSKDRFKNIIEELKNRQKNNGAPSKGVPTITGSLRMTLYSS
jgi:hypothetical protein